MLPIDDGLTLEQTLRTLAFWVATEGTTLSSLIHTAVVFCLVPIIRERGQSDHDATAMLRVFASFLAGGQLVGGMLVKACSLGPRIPLALSLSCDRVISCCETIQKFSIVSAGARRLPPEVLHQFRETTYGEENQEGIAGISTDQTTGD